MRERQPQYLLDFLTRHRISKRYPCEQRRCCCCWPPLAGATADLLLGCFRSSPVDQRLAGRSARAAATELTSVCVAATADAAAALVAAAPWPCRGRPDQGRATSARAARVGGAVLWHMRSDSSRARRHRSAREAPHVQGAGGSCAREGRCTATSAESVPATEGRKIQPSRVY
jgi:hypothetical protein